MFLSQQKEVRWKGRKEGIVIKTGREGRGRREDSVQEKEREEEEGIPTGGGGTHFFIRMLPAGSFFRKG